MSIRDGAKLFRHTYGIFAEGELPPTKTAKQRARLQRRANQGDLAAREALDQYAAARHVEIHADLAAHRTD